MDGGFIKNNVLEKDESELVIYEAKNGNNIKLDANQGNETACLTQE